MKNKVMALFSIMLVAFVLSGCAAISEFVSGDRTPTIRTFSDWTDEEVFQTIPAMVVDNTKVSGADACGADTYMITVSGTTLEDYETYLKLYEPSGFVKYSDNGDGLEGNVYTTTFTKEQLVVTVTQAVNLERTYIIVGEDFLLSENLIYNDSMIADNKPGAKTTLHAMELYENGNSFLIQLKNGHFIMNDGGNEEDLSHLIEYMESLVPKGEKPVIDAWFISHAHSDHVGVFNAFMDDMSYIKRIAVEAVYFSEPSNKSNQANDSASTVMNFMIDYKFLKNSKGETPDLYTPQTGQRFYFNDITVDIVFCQEIHPIENYGGGYNDTSTWLMYTIEGQKFLLPGDGSYGTMQTLMGMYSQEYFDLDLFAVCHHGINVYNYFTDYLTLHTVIYTNYRIGSLYSTGNSASLDGNEHMSVVAKELIAWGDGTKTFTFPYEMGTVKTQPAIDWTLENIDRKKHAWGERLEEYKTYILNP